MAKVEKHFSKLLKSVFLQFKILFSYTGSVSFMKNITVYEMSTKLSFKCHLELVRVQKSRDQPQA